MKEIEICKNENIKGQFLNKMFKFSIDYGIKEVIKSIIMPKLIEILLNWFKNILNEKLLPPLLDKFDENFETIGTHLIILQKKYNIKTYMDNVLKNINRFFNIICGINKLVIPYIKKAIKNTKENGVDTNKIITDFTNDLVSKVEIKIIKPIKEFINCVFGKNDELEKYKLYENVITVGYQKIRKIGIENYEKAKIYVNTKYDEIKESYLNKRKEICELPEQLEKKFNEKKDNIIKEYEKIKKDIIESTDEKINQLQNLNLTTEFRKYFSFFKDIINKNLNDIKEKTKTKIYELTNIIPDFIDYIGNIIDEILNLDFGNFSEDKINISEHIMNFISEVLSDNIKLQYKNENDEIIDKNIKEELIKYLNENLNIEAKKNHRYC